MKYTHALLGGTGHIGAALAQQLLDQKKSILIIGHSADKQKEWKDKGAAYEVADVQDSEMLHKLFAQAERLFILNPPADPAGDAEQTELSHIQGIGQALAGLNPKKIVMASTYGARDEKNIFDLGTLYQLEQILKAQGSTLAIIRSAYYMSNFDLPAQLAMQSGKLTTVLPADLTLPMIAPTDIGNFAAQLLGNHQTGTFHLQAKAEYSANDAAAILSDLLEKDITTHEIPEKQWESYMKANGFSAKSARSFIGMTKLTIEEKFQPEKPVHGDTSLSDYLNQSIKVN